jgi:hypothetical protein
LAACEIGFVLSPARAPFPTKPALAARGEGFDVAATASIGFVPSISIGRQLQNARIFF